MKTSFLTLIIVLLAGVQGYAQTQAEPWVACMNNAILECDNGYEATICTEFSPDGEACLYCLDDQGERGGVQGCGGPGWATAPRNTNCPDCRSRADGGSIDQTNGNYHKSVPVSGGSLEYNSERTSNRAGAYKIEHTIFDEVPTFLSTYELKVEVAGRVETFNKTATDTTISYTWDGLDNNGQPAKGVQKLVATLTIPGEGDLSQTFNIGVMNNESMGSGDWSFSGQNSYSPSTGRLHTSNGVAVDTPAVSLAFAGFAPGDLGVLSPSGDKMYVFNSEGVQQNTLSALTGAVLETFTYDVNGKLEKITDAYGAETIFLRNASGELAGVQGPDGLMTTIAMIGGQVTSVTSPEGEVHSMTYAASGMLETFAKPSGKTTTFELDADGNIVKSTDNGGNFFNYAPVATHEDLIKMERTSNMGRVETIWSLKSEVRSGTQTLSPLGVKTVIGGDAGEDGLEYWEEGDSSRLINYQGDVRFGALNRVPLKVTEVQDNRTSVTDYTYGVTLNDPANPFSINTYAMSKDVNGRVGTSVYTGATKTWLYTSPEGRLQTTVIDDFEKPVIEQTGVFTPVTYVYDTRGRIDTVTQGSRVTDYTYDAKGFVSEVENALGEVTSYTYDDDGRVLTTTLPDLRVVTSLYDSNGNLTELTPDGKPKHSMLYNAYELIQQYLPPVLGGTSAPIDYVYNADKELIRVDRPDGTSVDYNRDLVKGVLNSISVGGIDQYSYTYSTKNGAVKTAASKYGVSNEFDYKGKYRRMAKWSDSISGDQTAKTTYNYNDNFWITKWSVQGSSASPIRNVWYQYDDDGLLTKAGKAYYTYGNTDPLLRKIVMGVVEENYSYSLLGELTGKDTLANGSAVHDLTYTRDALGRVDTKTEVKGGVSHTYDYDYDSSGRLTEVKKDAATLSTYSYDGNNNRIGGVVNGAATVATYDDQDRVLAYNNLVFTYNDNGERISRTDTSTNKTTTYAYTSLGQLESATLPNGKKVEYTYDGLGRRVTRSFDGNLKTRYVYQGKRLVAEIHPTNGTVVKRYIYVSDSHSPDYMIRWSKQFKFIKDHLGSIVMAIDQADGSVFQEIEYDEFGNVLSETKPWLHPFRFAGGIYEGRTKLTKFGVREYDAETGQWTSKDPILFAGGDTKLYGYVGSDPVNYIDPEGKSPTVLAGAVAGLFVGLATSQCDPLSTGFIKDGLIGAIGGGLIGVGVGIGGGSLGLAGGLAAGVSRAAGSVGFNLGGSALSLFATGDCQNPCGGN